ncbi:hypothetical protein FRC08_010063 [Ceratobasidium sp. 394]|nr:hypothetical protein FRC08_010063 [Ceratobasidium sp. 394]KAG9078555.1 hypothetical protein FS749_009404 [Ceratobasidium sp. UAMH 11750]
MTKRNTGQQEWYATSTQVYKLPVTPREMRRQNKQHHAFMAAMGGLYPESYAQVVRQQLGSRSAQVADFGSGSGDWVSDIAKEFPRAQAIGIDLTPSSPADAPPNVRQVRTSIRDPKRLHICARLHRFETRDVNQNMDEHYGKLDMIHARNLACGIIDFPTFLQSTWRCLKPGGIIMIMDSSFTAYDENFSPINPTTGFIKLYHEVASRMRTPNGTDVHRYTDRVIAWVREHGGFENIRVGDLYIPTGWSGSGKYCKDPELAGSIMRENMKVIIHSWKSFLLTTGASEAEVDSWIADAGKELETPGRLRAYVRWVVVCAQKSA